MPIAMPSTRPPRSRVITRPSRMSRCASLRVDALLPALEPRFDSRRQLERSGKQENNEKEHRREQLRSPAPDRRGKPPEAQRRREHDDGIEGGGAPGVAAEMQPPAQLRG